MTIGPISNNTQPPPQLVPYTNYDTKAWRDRFGDAFAASAAALGMSKSDLINALQSGQKMKDIEAVKGVSKDDVIAAAAAALQKDDPSLSATQATQLATMQYDGKIGHRHHHHHSHKVSGTPPVLGMSDNDNENDPSQPATGIDVLS